MKRCRSKIAILIDSLVVFPLLETLRDELRLSISIHVYIMTAQVSDGDWVYVTDDKSLKRLQDILLKEKQLDLSIDETKRVGNFLVSFYSTLAANTLSM